MRVPPVELHNYATSFVTKPLSPAERSFGPPVPQPARKTSFFGRIRLFFFLYRDARSVGYTRLGAWRAARKSC